MSSSTAISDLFSTTEPPELGPGPRAGIASIAEVDAKIPDAVGSGSRRNLVRALVLLWHDHLDAAHDVVQDLENADGSYIHAILHRREPDYGNAKYWFRRVGRHACYPELARRVSEFLRSKEDASLRSKLIPRGEWDAFQFVDLCEAAATKAGAGAVKPLRCIQRIEFEILLERLLATN